MLCHWFGGLFQKILLSLRIPFLNGQSQNLLVLLLILVTSRTKQKLGVLVSN